MYIVVLKVNDAISGFFNMIAYQLVYRKIENASSFKYAKRLSLLISGSRFFIKKSRKIL